LTGPGTGHAHPENQEEEEVRRLLGMIMLVLAAGALSPAAVAAVRRPADPAPDRFGVRLVDVPVSEANNPRALRYIIDYLPTGTVIHRRILILNQEPRTAHFTVYADAARIANGLFTGDAGATRSELTGWISVQHPAVTLRPDASVTDLVTIKVPQGATRGEQYAVIWVQQAAYVRAANGFGVNDVVRVGIRVYLAVGRGGAPPTNFTITTITGRRSAAGWPSIVARVDNTGGRAVDLNGTARLTGGPGNTAAGPFRAQQIITLAPGQSGNMTFGPPKNLPNGPWQASITLVSGLTVSTATATIQFAALVTSHPGLSLMAWLGIAAVAAVAVIALVLARQATRRRAPA
jgi:hypothetical protein